MARVRYLGPEPVTVPELGRTVEPDEIVEVPDERYWGYACQTTNWEEVSPPPNFVVPGTEPDEPAEPEAPLAKVPAKKTTAAKPQKDEG
ncbi:hypothetical protein [Streptomyces turgidiscabies]|uniref:hypothetical protein n=1 Tax=Streptomyces turgidiscabies TaxID=85558 RepID=UPI0038F7A95C